MGTLVQPRCVKCYSPIEPDLVSFGSDVCRGCRDPHAAKAAAKAHVDVGGRSARRRQEGMTQGLLAWSLASAVLAVIGAFGPWAKVFVISVNGTDASHDGWVVAAAAGFGGLLVYVRRTTASAGSWALVAGIVALLPAIYDREHLTRWISDNGPLAQAIFTSAGVSTSSSSRRSASRSPVSPA